MQGPRARTVIAESRWLNPGSLGFAVQAAVHTVAAAAAPGFTAELAGLVPAFFVAPMLLAGAAFAPSLQPVHPRTIAKLTASGALLLVGGIASMVGGFAPETQTACAALATVAAAWCAARPTPRQIGYARSGDPVYEA